MQEPETIEGAGPAVHGNGEAIISRQEYQLWKQERDEKEAARRASRLVVIPTEIHVRYIPSRL